MLVDSCGHHHKLIYRLILQVIDSGIVLLVEVLRLYSCKPTKNLQLIVELKCRSLPLDLYMLIRQLILTMHKQTLMLLHMLRQLVKAIPLGSFLVVRFRKCNEHYYLIVG